MYVNDIKCAIHSVIKDDEFVKSRNMHNFVIPVETGIQCFQIVVCFWIPAYAGMTDFLRVHQGWFNICSKDVTFNSSAKAELFVGVSPRVSAAEIEKELFRFPFKKPVNFRLHDFCHSGCKEINIV